MDLLQLKHNVHSLRQILETLFLPMITYRFAFQEGHSGNVTFHFLSELFLNGFPCIANIMHLLRAHQLHCSVTL